MFLRAAFRYAFCGITVVLSVQAPCLADWADSFATSVLKQVVKQEASRWIRQKLYSSPRGSQSHYAPPQHHHRLTSTENDGEMAGKMRKQQYDNVDIPAPPSNGYGLEVPPPPSGRPAAGEINGLTPGGADECNDIQSDVAPRHIPDSSTTNAFDSGTAGDLSFRSLVHSGVFVSCPMSGGTHMRHDEVRYIILHSTETASPADAQRVIHSWSNRGSNHPGAQFVVDRDGTIYATTDPDNVATHINVHKALAGYTNENSIGIEIVRAGSQHYTRSQLSSVLHLVTYLQQHYGVPDSNVTTHAHVQPSDRSDPVNFNMIVFEHEKAEFRSGTALATKPKPAYPAVVHAESGRLSSAAGKMPPLAPTFHRAI